MAFTPTTGASATAAPRPQPTNNSPEPTQATPTTMRALAQDAYGPPDVLRLVTAPVPEPGPGQVLVRVHASSVNARDWHIMRGEPRLARVLDRTVFGRQAPQVPIRGTDFAGTIQTVGEHVTGWRPGDLVFGEADAAWAEYTVASQDAITQVPASVTPQEAATLPLAGTTALTCLDAARLRSGDYILINGASGGVGTFTIQMAHARGMYVTAVCSARNAAQAKALGANKVIDYATTDFCATGERYDAVLDLVGNRSVRELRKLVRNTGALVLSGGGVPGTGHLVGPLGLLVRAQFLSRTPGPRIVIPQALPTTTQLRKLGILAGTRAAAPVVDRVFDLADGADAVRYVETEHARGKVLLTITPWDVARDLSPAANSPAGR
ncbi:NADPH:quinone reductase [Pedococcus cremeus]|uniref:NADPH:quinone reductase n=1 Tax=Pedococcus cremeus TaxID=587636 RepID=A0A1H9XSE6_9MICO|nr:NAD(P)-dependent alcohol dehydrogenase [Pedococcus cremeus]SES48969.1 NADPH:quinone reductase [Pedococcus cremeus]